jgi:hypothetical protein
MNKVIRRLYVDPETNNWVGRLDPLEESSFPEVVLREIMFDGDVSDIAYSDADTSDELNSLILSKYFSDSPFVMPLTRVDRPNYMTKQDLITSILSNVMAMRDFRDSFEDSANNDDSARYSRLFNMGISNLSPGFIPYRDTSLSVVGTDYDSIDSAITAVTGLASNYGKVSQSLGNTLSAKVVPLSPERSENAFFPGDLLKLLISGGSGVLSRIISGITPINNTSDIYRVNSQSAGTFQQTLKDTGTSITININVTLPNNITNEDGSEEEV